MLDNLQAIPQKKDPTDETAYRFSFLFWLPKENRNTFKWLLRWLNLQYLLKVTMVGSYARVKQLLQRKACFRIYCFQNLIYHEKEVIGCKAYPWMEWVFVGQQFHYNT